MNRTELLPNEQTFLHDFESSALAPGEFHHADHIRVVWLYLRQYPVTEVLSRVSDGIKRFATKCGQPGLYHETITWAYVFLVHERMQGGARDGDWNTFKGANADLMIWRDGILKNYYRDLTIQSDLAKKMFLLPDKGRGE